ncbi:MAG: methyltransferase domain-containing protein [Phycisphaerae bacterium]|nr:methyltransferase domain-containing protein [Phycisphaerae bacterium]
MARRRPKSGHPVGNSAKRQLPANGKISYGARTLAIDVLNRTDPKRNYAGAILDGLLEKTAERQRATDLVFGTIRNRSAIDRVITVFSSRPTERIPAKLLNIIRVAAYELIYRPQTPAYSIVNEAVENAKALAGKKQVGFVNAVLRNIARQIANRQAGLAGADIEATLPQTPSTGCVFNTSFMPDPQALPADYLSAAFSLPLWLVTDWLAEFGFEKTRQICFASNRRPSIYIRPNPLKTTIQQLAEKLQQADIDFEIVPPDVQQPPGIKYRASSIEHRESGMIRLRSAAAVTQLPGFADGLFTVQDLTASHAVKALNPQAKWEILDLCAAPGVKTTQLAEITGGSAQIVATDINSERLKKVEENTVRLGIDSVRIVAYGDFESRVRRVESPPVAGRKLGPFDAVLLDAPCSNTGVLAKRIEVRYRLNPAAIEELAETQSQLLQQAAAMIKAGGKICYSTCSIQKNENSERIGDFLRQNSNFKLESERLILPSPQAPAEESACEKDARQFDHDGGYVAVVVRK